ncbi:MAG: class II fructose-bisphosphate aldolase [Sphaerochaeta sp.]
MYTNIKTILSNAAKQNYAVIATSPINMETARGMVRAASKKHAPIIFLLGQNMMRQHAKAEILIPMIKTLANEYSNVPIATCLDHGSDDERIMYAFRNSFSSIMFDGSLYPMEENIKRTRAVADLCHRFDMGIEGELGHVGIAANGDGHDESIYTNPADAKKFVDSTGVDCLAVAVGTAHGEYPKGLIPHINFQRIMEIKNSTGGMPIALHGGSGSGDENIIKAVKAGINKVNMVTDVFLQCRDYTAKTLAANPKTSYMELMMGVETTVMHFIERWIALTGSEGKADLIKPIDRMGLLSPSCTIGLSE